MCVCVSILLWDLYVVSLGSTFDENPLLLQYNLDMGYVRFIMFSLSEGRFDNGISASIEAALHRQILKELHVQRFAMHV